MEFQLVTIPVAKTVCYSFKSCQKERSTESSTEYSTIKVTPANKVIMLGLWKGFLNHQRYHSSWLTKNRSWGDWIPTKIWPHEQPHANPKQLQPHWSIKWLCLKLDFNLKWWLITSSYIFYSHTVVLWMFLVAQITIWLFNIANWKIPTINRGLVRRENHVFLSTMASIHGGSSHLVSGL